MDGPADRIELHGLRLLGRHGLLPEERSRAQPFEVDLAIEADLAPSGAHDDLVETVDYGKVVSRVAEVVQSGDHLLLEALAEAIASVVLSDERALAVTVSVRKLRPPVPHDLASAGVTIRRSRAPGQPGAR